MIGELGHLSLILAFGLACLLAVLPLVGAQQYNLRLMRASVPLSIGVFIFSSLSIALLIVGFVQDDFSLKVVAQNSNLSLPVVYKVTALWGGHEGSLLLWMYILTCWLLAVALFSKNVPIDIRARVLAVMAMVFVGFALFALLTSNPFERTFPNVPQDGKDLNPLLQDPGMIIHPPMLYFGYVGFSVAFAFAIAALLSGEVNAVWVRWVRPWTTAAWGFLTGGIALGSWWAYYELGWGGWWFWDPVENASFMPWLVGTALMHSLAVSEKRDLFRSWTLLLAIFAFSLSLLGTFLVRSGVLTSVHAFAADPSRGLFILAFLAVVVGGSLSLFALKAPTVSRAGSFSFFSREMFLLFNNILLVVATLTVLVGTLFPLVADFLELGKYSVGPPYFNSLFVPLMLALMLCLGLGSLLNWKQTRAEQLRKLLVQLVPYTLVFIALLLALYMTEASVPIIVGISFAAWVMASSLIALVSRLKNASSIGQGFKRLPASFYAMQFGHIGLAVTVVGIALVSYYGIEKDVKMSPGDSLVVSDYRFEFQGTKEVMGANYRADQGQVKVFEIDKDEETFITMLKPEKRNYLSQMSNVMTDADIHATLSRDLFVALGEPLDNGAWAVRIQYKPLIRWIWLGAIFMMIGSLIAISDKRYRK